MASRLPSWLRRGGAPPGFDGVLVLRRGRLYDPDWDRWRPIRRWPGILAATVVTVGLLVSIGYAETRHTPNPIRHHGPHVTASDFVVPAYFPPSNLDAEHVQSFSGTRSAYNLALVSPGGLTQWNFSCKCSANFDVQVYNTTGTLIDIPLNSIGPTHLAANASYPAGDYLFNVQADGPWSIQFIPEGGLPVIDRTFSYFSHGTSVLGPFSPTDNVLVAGYIANLGQLMTVQVVDKSGTAYETPIFSIESFTKTQTLTNLPNPYYLIVQGEGTWLVQVKPSGATTT